MNKRFVSIFPGNTKRYLENAIFDSTKRDDWNIICIKLKQFLNKKNVDINTYDVSSKETPFKYVYFDLPYLWDLGSLPVWKMIFSHKEKNILLCNETPIVIPYDYWKILHIFFKKVYTWNDDLVDNKKYFKIYLPQDSLGLNTILKKFQNKKFLTLINANKSALFPFKVLSPFGKELYSERIKAIEFFEKNIPDKFFLYGRGWDRPKKYNFTENIFGFKKYSTYKGEIKIGGKVELLSNFKYCICFENITNVNGFITEKIFDCFKAKCIPIYWGATNIEKYIPKNCFIDFRDFGYDYEKLLIFLNEIDENRYNEYIANTEKLLSNEKFKTIWFEKGFFNFFLEAVLEIKEG